MGVFAGPEIPESGLVLAIDAANRKSYSNNYHPNPIDIYSWVGPAGGYQQSLSRDTIQSPVGNTPLKIVTSGTSSYSGSYNSLSYNIASAASGQTWTVSFYVKSSVSTTISMLIFESNSSGGYLTYTQPFFNIGTDWTRVSGTATFSQATTASIQTRIDCYVSGVTLWVDGYQVERSSTMSTFTSVYTGDISKNTISSSNNGTLTNGVSYSDSNASSFVFNGTNSYISVPDSTSVNPGTGSFSIVAWVNSDPSNGGDGWDLWVAKRAPANGSNGYYLGVNNPLGAKFMLGNDANSRTDTGYLTYTYNTWAMFTAILDRTANTQTIIKNDNTESSSVTPSGGNYSNTGALSIGGDIGIGAYYVNGKIANVQMYNRALSTSEVSQIFNASRGRFGI